MTSLRYRPEIDGLRALAVIAVVLYHAAPGLLPGGFVGVDVFFVISGYLITSLLSAEWNQRGRIDFPAFYARRVRRLLPALIVVVVAVMAAAVIMLGRHGAIFEQVGESAVAALFFVANIYFQNNSGGYFHGPSDNFPLLHLWSLSVEEQYYLVYPALLAFFFRYVPGGARRWLVILSVLSLLLAEYWVGIEPDLAFYQMPARFWELALGGVLALTVVPAAVSVGDRIAMVAGLLLLAASFVSTPVWGVFPGSGAIPSVLGAVCVMYGVHRGVNTGLAAASLRYPPLVWVGVLSYSLYLWHWPLLAIDAGLRLDPAPLAWRLFLCVVALLLAWLSWRFVEMPFRRRSVVEGRRVVVWGVAASLVAACAVAAMAQVDRIPPEARRMADTARIDWPAGMRECHFDFDDRVESLKPAACRSQPLVAPTLVLWGDSHALAWKPFAWRLADAAGESAMAATMNSCLPGNGRSYNGTPLRSEDCAAMNELALQSIESGDVNTVIVALRWPLGSAEASDLPPEFRGRVDGLAASFERMRKVPRILVMGPVPFLKRAAPECISRGWEHECSVPRARHEELTALAWRELRTLAHRFPSVTLIDPTDFFCDARVCPVARDGYGLFWDNNHVSATAALAFADRYLADPTRYTVRNSDDERKNSR